MKITAPKTNYELLRWISAISYIVLIFFPIVELLYSLHFGFDIVRLIVVTILMTVALISTRLNINNIQKNRIKIKYLLFIALICIFLLRSYRGIEFYFTSDFLVAFANLVLLFIIFNCLSRLIDKIIKK